MGIKREKRVMAATSNGNVTSITISPLLGLIIGAIIIFGIGFFAFVDNYLSTNLFVAFLATYAVAGTALGTYLIQQDGTVPSWLKYVVLIVVSGAAYGLTTWQNIHITLLNVALVATFFINLATFILDEVQQYKPFLPAQLVNDATLVIGGVIVVAQTIANAPAGSLTTVQVLLASIVPALFAYIIQVATPGATPTPTPTPVGTP